MHLSTTHSTMVHMHPQQPRDSARRSGAYALAKLRSVPNQPKNKNKPVRVSEELWAEFGKVCADEGTDRAKDLRAYMERRVRRWKRLQAKRQGDPGE
jgi:hypothetical protein